MASQSRIEEEKKNVCRAFSTTWRVDFMGKMRFKREIKVECVNYIDNIVHRTFIITEDVCKNDGEALEHTKRG